MAASSHQRDQLLDFFFHYMSSETRGKLMQELPQAYNAWVGREIVKVEKISDEPSGE